MWSNVQKIVGALTARERRIMGSAALLFLVFAGIVGFRSFYRRTVSTPVVGGSYTEGIIGQPTGVNPLLFSGNDADRDLLQVMFSDLGVLAEKIQSNEDHRIWTALLKPDLQWSDGEPITADDVVFTLETIQNPESRSPLLPLWQGVVGERLSEREVRFTLKLPYAFFEDNVRNLVVAPQHIFGVIPSANLRLSAYNFEPVGSGPYTFESYEKRKDGFIASYALTANSFYVGAQPLIPHFTFRFFENKEDTIRAFNRKEIDGLGGLEEHDIAALKIGHQMDAFSLPRYYAIFLNSSVHPALKYIEVRRAMNLATDKRRLVEEIFRGQAAVVSGPIPSRFLTDAATTSPDEPFSIARAEEILEDAGWRKNEEGTRMKTIEKETVSLKFEFIVPRIPFLIAAADVVKSDWRKAGMDVSIIAMNPSEVTADVIKSRRYELLIFGNILRRNPDVFSFWHSTERFYPGFNLALYENKTVDALLESVRREFDPAVRERLLLDLTDRINEDRPAIFLFSPLYLYAHPKNLGGLEVGAIESPAYRLSAVHQWFLKTTRIFQ